MQYLMIENCAFKAGISGTMGYALGTIMGLFMYGVPGAEVQAQSKEKLENHFIGKNPKLSLSKLIIGSTSRMGPDEESLPLIG